MKRHFLALLPLAAFLLLVGLFAAPLLRGTDPGRIESAMIGKPAPAFILPAAVPGARHLSSEDLAGAPSLVNFFASWCVPCQAEQPVLERIAEEEGIAIFGINYKDREADAEAWLQAHGNPFRATGADREGRVAIDWGVYGVPETFLVDAAGRIRYRHVGPLTEADYQNVLRPLIAELRR